MQAGQNIDLAEVNPTGNAKIQIATKTKGSQAIDGTILSGDTEVELTILGLVFGQAAVSGKGLAASQRNVYLKDITDDGTDTTLTVAIDSSHSEDIDVHAVASND